MDFLKDIRKRYLELSRDESDRFVLIDGNQAPDIVEKEAIRHIDKICLKKKVL